MPRILINRFGGANYADPPAELVARSFNRGQQVSPVESPDLRNVDFIKGWLGKRKGSAVWEDLTSVLVASEELISGHSWTIPDTGVEAIVIVGKKSIYLTQDASAGTITWTQINDSGSSAYTHSADVTKCSFAEVDNHLLIGIDGANKIQVYKASADLDPELDNANLWENTFGGGTNAVTGTWGAGYYNVTELHGRLIINKGDSVIEYTDVSKPWDLLGGGFYGAKSNVVAIKTWTRRAGNEYGEVLAMFTDAGVQWIAGFLPGDVPYSINAGREPASYRSVVAMDNWMVWMTRDGSIEATNLVDVIELGRRLKSGDGASGPMDTFSATNTKLETKVFGVREDKRALFFYPDATNSINSHAILMDFQLGEPVLNEPLESYERRVRHSVFSIKEPATNPWFVGGFNRRGAVTCILAVGTTWDISSGLNDLDVLPVLDYWDTPEFDGGAPSSTKEWGRTGGQFVLKGSWNVHVDAYLNGEVDPAGSGWDWSMATEGIALWDSAVWDAALWSSGENVQVSEWADYVSHGLKLRLKNQETSKDWELRTLEIRYNIGAESN